MLFVLSSLFAFKAQAQMAFWSASEDDFYSAPCKVRGAPTLSEIDDYLANINGRKLDANHNGVSFINESKLLLKAYKDLTGNKDIEKKLGIGSHCQSVLCAVEKIWGDELGKKLLYMRVKHGFNGSEYAFSDASRFELSEIDQVLETLTDLPSSLQPLGRGGNQRLAPAAVGSLYQYKKVAGNVSADAEIKLYDVWRNSPNDYMRQYALFHELGHNVARTKGHTYSPIDFKALHELPACAVSKYGETNTAEDFAETFAAYRYNGSALKASCPAKFDYMKKNFYAEVEFTDEVACNRAPVIKVKKKFRLQDIFDLKRLTSRSSL